MVSITRAAGSVTYPAQFILVAASNPCPCGYLGDEKRVCKCSPRMIMRYQNKLSGPLMDRIDLHLTIAAVDTDKLMAKAPKLKAKTSRDIREEVVNARQIQKKRFAKDKIIVNADMKNKHIKKYCELGADSQLLLKQAVNTYGLSARTYFRLIKVSRTIADLEGATNIQANHVAETLQYRVRSVD